MSPPGNPNGTPDAEYLAHSSIPPAEVNGFSSVHHAFFAEAFFDPTTQPPTYLGCGTGFWDYKPELSPWG